MTKADAPKTNPAPPASVSLDDFDLVIFDFDGVIADSEILSLATLQQSLEDHGISLSLQDVREKFLGRSLAAIRTYIAEHNPDSPADGFTDTWQSELFIRFHKELSPIANVQGFLDILTFRELRYCIASSGTFERINVALAAMQMTQLFDHVFSAEQVRRGKPAPDLFLHAAAHLGIEQNKCLVIEDSPFGVSAAKAANMRCVGFVGGAHLQGIAAQHGELLLDNGADLIIHSYGELAPELCKNQG